jgi:hypothetical protein
MKIRKYNYILEYSNITYLLQNCIQSLNALNKLF